MIAAALLLAVAFGAGDQYLGSLSAHPWAADLSLLSAPWIVLAFAAGWTQREPRRGALLGLACTCAALIGYGLMTLSPFEHAQLSLRTAAGFVHSESIVFVGGFVTGPLFGLLGNRWRLGRAWPGAAIAASTLLLEPVVHHIRFRTVSLAETAAGTALLAYVALAGLRARSRS